jgi:hypothetical protein
MNTIKRSTAVCLLAVGPLIFVGGAIHPHAPDAHTMPQVLWVQTGQAIWWPAHVCLLAGETLFAVFLLKLSRTGGVPNPLSSALRILVPVAWACVVGMGMHLLLPIGRDSVVDSRYGWDFWVKDIGETVDAIWAMSVGVVAWVLYRNHVLTSRWLVAVGVAAGTCLGAFSLAIPLTGALWTADAFQPLLPAVPLIATLLTAGWATGAGVILLRRKPLASRGHRGLVSDRAL